MPRAATGTRTRARSGPEAPEAAAGGGPGDLLEVRGVDFSYGSLQVLHSVSFSVIEGEVLALVGTNGAGKSTLLRVAAGLEHPSAGAVIYGGKDITGVPAEDRVRLGIGLLMGGHSLFGDLTVDENLRVGATTLRRLPDLDQRIAGVFDLFPQLTTRRRQPASSLSGGEQQMLALAKVLILQPRLLMIDELSLGLAPIVVAELLQVLRRVRDEGTTVVVVEQSVAVAAEIADRAVHMEKGQVGFTGRPDELMEAEVAKAVFFGAGH
jgi:ABC-type branched-subunit amino acid transport system ATPase component